MAENLTTKSGEADGEIMIAEKSLQGIEAPCIMPGGQSSSRQKGGSFWMSRNRRVLIITVLYVERQRKFFDGFPITLVVKY